MLTESISEVLEHLVFDANEVVTYKWISRKWELHANLAKRLLHDFVTEQRRAGKSLCSWHAVLCAGSVTLVPEAKLARCLRRWPKSRAHIYAVLTSRTEDSNVICLADAMPMCNMPQDVRYSSVKPTKALAKRSDSSSYVLDS
ncbi:DNA polymerase delta subunit 3-like [Dermacentor albipictus]|uniref:DNA polymerase delta subunit 3-like n=1 Tax=Dermacentor albipictus TaxID=60249 RepID=UPI0038FC38C8